MPRVCDGGDVRSVARTTLAGQILSALRWGMAAVAVLLGLARMADGESGVTDVFQRFLARHNGGGATARAALSRVRALSYPREGRSRPAVPHRSLRHVRRHVV